MNARLLVLSNDDSYRGDECSIRMRTYPYLITLQGFTIDREPSSV